MEKIKLLSIDRVEPPQAKYETARYNFLVEREPHPNILQTIPLVVKAAYVNRPEKRIICLSTEIGCQGLCSFCSAATKLYQRPLKAEEMIYMAATIIRAEKCDNRQWKDVLISFMGTGDPLCNLHEVIKVMRHNGFDGCRYALSVGGRCLNAMGLLGMLDIMPNVKVQFTLVSGNEEIRSALQPNTESLVALSTAIFCYPGPKEVSVPLISGINDSPERLKEIADFMRSLNIEVPVKIQKYHPMNGFEGVSLGKTTFCMRLLREYGLSKLEYYETDGEEINAACGQFEL